MPTHVEDKIAIILLGREIWQYFTSRLRIFSIPIYSGLLGIVDTCYKKLKINRVS